MAQVELGTWRSTAPIAIAPAAPTTFYGFAAEWFDAKQRDLRPNTRLDYAWRLNDHLFPFFGTMELGQITTEQTDRYRDLKKGEGKLSNNSINKTLVVLGQVLDVAEERGLVEKNPMRVNPRRRKLKLVKPPPVWLESAVQIEALLDAAAVLDREAWPGHRHVPRRAMLATMCFAGLRIGELCALRWRDVDLAAGELRVGASKTDAGVRRVSLLPALRAELAGLRPDIVPMDRLVFATSNGTAPQTTHVRNRVFNRSVELADEELRRRDEMPLPRGLTPHKLRHTFASLLVALGEDPAYIMGQLGHTDPAFTLRVYAHG